MLPCQESLSRILQTLRFCPLKNQKKMILYFLYFTCFLCVCPLQSAKNTHRDFQLVGSVNGNIGVDVARQIEARATRIHNIID